MQKRKDENASGVSPEHTSLEVALEELHKKNGRDS